MPMQGATAGRVMLSSMLLSMRFMGMPRAHAGLLAAIRAAVWDSRTGWSRGARRSAVPGTAACLIQRVRDAFETLRERFCMQAPQARFRLEMAEAAKIRLCEGKTVLREVGPPA